MGRRQQWTWLRQFGNTDDEPTGASCAVIPLRRLVCSGARFLIFQFSVSVDAFHPRSFVCAQQVLDSFERERSEGLRRE